jgi:hypothetical protein
MSIYDKASLVLIPSGTKTSKVYSQKPVNGDGDFTFSRSTAATRVNADGNIEKETQNLLLQSNSFDTTWYNSATAVTSGQAGYDGTNDAWLASRGGPFNYVAQDISTSGVQSYSIYAKAGSFDWIYVRVQNSALAYRGAYFDLSGGSVGAVDSAIIDTKIESVGNEYYRCTILFNETLNRVLFYPVPSNNGVGAGGSGTIYVQDAQLEQGLVARDYIETTTAAVEGGITDNVPRLDYTDSSCPALLLEPIRTNVVTQSEYFDAWTQSLGSAISNNSVISPEGVQNGSTLSFGNNVQSRIYQVGSHGSATYVMSIYAKSSTGKQFRFKISDGVTDAFSSDITTTTEWQRYDFEYTGSLSNWGITNDSSAIIGSIDIYGAQLEAGNYSTSLIPTYGTSVTRNGDSCSVTGVSDVIGQTEGTWFVEYTRNSLVESSYFVLSQIAGTTAGSYVNSIYLFQLPNGHFVSDGFVSNAIQFGFTKNGGLSLGKHKIAIAYKQNDFALYIDGVQIGTDTSGNVPQMNYLTIGGGADVTGHRQSIHQTLLFKARLSNQELIDLTTI